LKAESKIPLPDWLPWGTTAVLAALVACLGELWMVERTRTQLLRDENALAATALKAADTQLESERIVSRRQVEELSAAAVDQTGLGLLLLSPPADSPGVPTGPKGGAVIWKPEAGQGFVTFAKGSLKPVHEDYQLWVVRPDGTATNCGVLEGDGDDVSRIPVTFDFPLERRCQFFLVDGKKGGASSFKEATDTGSIVLASLPWDGRILNR